MEKLTIVKDEKNTYYAKTETGEVATIDDIKREYRETKKRHKSLQRWIESRRGDIRRASETAGSTREDVEKAIRAAADRGAQSEAYGKRLYALLYCALDMYAITKLD